MTDRQLQRDFSGKVFNIDGIERECYYCTLEDGGAWFCLRPIPEDKCKRVNFIVKYSDSLERLYREVLNGEVISEKEYGYLDKYNQ